MNIPIDVVVELLMIHGRFEEKDSPFDEWSLEIGFGKFVYADTSEDLTAKVRTYLQSLVPTPKLLSECEEFEYLSCQYQPGIGVMRDGEFAYEADGTCGGLAKDFQVIQPVEVQ